jgi:hypothetical protein
MVTASALLKQKLDAPVAPSIPSVCPETSGSGGVADPIAAFVRKLREPEMGLINRLLAAANELQLRGEGGEDQLDLVEQLGSRLVAKVAAMLKLTKPTPDTVLPAVIAAVSIATRVAQLGADTSALLTAIPRFTEAALNDSIERIAKGHDYRQLQVVWEIAKRSALLGGAALASDVDAALVKALQFDANLSVDESNPEATWTMGGTVRMTYPGILKVGRDVLTGQGTIRDISYHDTIGLKLEPKPFVVHASLSDIDMCAGTAMFGVDQFYMDNEAYKDSTGGGITLGRSWINWMNFYGDHGGRDGWTWFAVKLHNGDAQWVDETIQAGDNGWFSEFSIVLNHQGS